MGGDDQKWAVAECIVKGGMVRRTFTQEGGHVLCAVQKKKNPPKPHTKKNPLGLQSTGRSRLKKIAVGRKRSQGDDGGGGEGGLPQFLKRRYYRSVRKHWKIKAQKRQVMHAARGEKAE